MKISALQRLFLVAVLFGLTFWLFRSAAQTQPVWMSNVNTEDTCAFETIPRAIVAGDSYTYYMWLNNIHTDAFNGFSYPEFTALGNGDFETGYSIPGSQAKQWADTANYPYLNNLLNEINAHPTVDIIYLSLGINDFVVPGKDEGGWYNGMPPEDEEAAFAIMRANIITVINAIQATRPDMHILLGGYDYINMFETGATGKAIWVKLLYPTTWQVNDAMARLEVRRISDIVLPEGIAYTQLMGVNHHTFGYDGTQGEPFPAGSRPLPGQIPPDYSPLPGGDIDYPTNLVGMRDLDNGEGKDPVHPNAAAFKAQLQMQEAYYFSFFHTETPDITLRSLGDLVDGYVRSDGGRSYTGITMGDSTSMLDYRGLMTFDLQAIPPGSTITAATLFLRRETGAGTSPFDLPQLGDPRVDIKTGTFGAPEIEASDYAAPADVVSGGCFHGAARDDQNLLRIIFTQAGRAALNVGGLTQMRVYFPNRDPNPNAVRFYDGDASTSFRPYLEINYTLPEHTPTPTPPVTPTPTPSPTPRPGYWGFLPAILHSDGFAGARPERR